MVNFKKSLSKIKNINIEKCYRKLQKIGIENYRFRYRLLLKAIVNFL